MPITLLVPSVDDLSLVSSTSATATQQVQAQLAALAAENTARIKELQAEVAALREKVSPAPKKFMLYSPLYVWPGTYASGTWVLSPAWQRLIDVKKAHPNLTVAAVVNHANGDFDLGIGILSSTIEAAAKPNPDFLAGISALRAGGVDVYGYIYTRWGARSKTTIMQRARLWQKLYGVKKIMWDEMDATVGRSGYYFDLKAQTGLLGYDGWIGNPGVVMPGEYIGSCSCIIVYEHTGLPTLADLQLRCFNGAVGYENFGLTPHTVTAYSSQWVTDAKKYAYAICVHNDGADGNPWNTQTSYLEQLANDLDPTITTSTTTTTTTTSSTTVAAK
jgi:hypothetical protein